MKIVVVMVLE